MTREDTKNGNEEKGLAPGWVYPPAQLRNLVGARVGISIEICEQTKEGAEWRPRGITLGGIIMSPPTTRAGEDESRVNIMPDEPIGSKDFSTLHPRFLSEDPFSVTVDGQELLGRLSFTLIRAPEPPPMLSSRFNA